MVFGAIECIPTKQIKLEKKITQAIVRYRINTSYALV